MNKLIKKIKTLVLNSTHFYQFLSLDLADYVFYLR